MVFNHVHFYDYMLFREEANRQITSNVESSLIIAISQSGETEAIINDVREAESKAFPPSASRAARIPSWRECRT